MLFIVTFAGQDRVYFEGIIAEGWQDADEKAKLLTGGAFYTLKAIYA